jgi:tetratricopeptide (TPR) repeat protein
MTQCQSALKLIEKQYGADHIESVAARVDLANVECNMGNYLKMQTLLDRALKVYEKFYGADHPKLSPVLVSLGLSYVSLGQPTRGVFERALAINSGYYGSKHPETIKIKLEMVSNESPIDGLLEILDELKRYYKAEHRDIANVLEKIGDAYSTMENSKGATKYYQEAIYMNKRC